MGTAMAIIQASGMLEKKVIAAYFESATLEFLLYDKGSIRVIVPSGEFDSHRFLEKIATLRTGSDRLIENLKTKRPDVYNALVDLSLQENATVFDAITILLRLEGKGYKALNNKSLKFIGKGGLKIDTKTKDNRFDNYAFLASIISFTLADVDTDLLAYSIFESLGDYFSTIVELKSRSGADKFLLCGEYFGNVALHSRITTHVTSRDSITYPSYPLSSDSAAIIGEYILF
jgi:hypothetical protein